MSPCQILNGSFEKRIAFRLSGDAREFKNQHDFGR